MKRITALLLILTFAVVIAACGNNKASVKETAPPAGTGTPQDKEKEPVESTAEPVELTFMVFETPNLSSAFWDNVIKMATDRHPNISIKKIVSPDIDRVKYARGEAVQLILSMLDYKG